MCWQCFKSFGPARPVVLSAWSKLSTTRSLNVFRAFKSKDTSTDEDEGQNTKSKKTFSFSIIFKERAIVTPTRIIQKNCSRISTCCTPPLPSPTFTETWFSRARLRLNTGHDEWNIYAQIERDVTTCGVLRYHAWGIKQWGKYSRLPVLTVQRSIWLFLCID